MSSTLSSGHSKYVAGATKRSQKIRDYSKKCENPIFVQAGQTLI